MLGLLLRIEERPPFTLRLSWVHLSGAPQTGQCHGKGPLHSVWPVVRVLTIRVAAGVGADEAQHSISTSSSSGSVYGYRSTALYGPELLLLPPPRAPSAGQKGGLSTQAPAGGSHHHGRPAFEGATAGAERARAGRPPAGTGTAARGGRRQQPGDSGGAQRGSHPPAWARERSHPAALRAALYVCMCQGRAGRRRTRARLEGPSSGCGTECGALLLLVVAIGAPGRR